MIGRLLGTPFGRGAVAGLLGALAMLGLRPFLDTPSLQELIVERLLILMGADVFNLVLQQVWTLGKTLGVIGTTFLVALCGGFISLAFLRAKTALPQSIAALPLALALGFGIGLWLLTNLALLPLLGWGFAGSGVPGPAWHLQLGLLLGFLVYGIALDWFFLDRTPTLVQAPESVSRRIFVTRSAGWLVAALAVAGGLRFLVSTTAHGLTTLARIRSEPTEMPSEITPTKNFYSVTKNLIDPDVAESSWRLQVGGQVDAPYALTVSDLRSLPSVEQAVTLECIENPVGGHLISNASWTGVRLRNILERARVQPSVARITFSSADGYEESLAVEDAMKPEVLVAYAMNGESLPRKHGFPARLIIPGRYGMKNIKWLEKISTTGDLAYRGYWGQRGWDNDAYVRTTSQIAIPTSLGEIIVGEVVQTGGIAYSGDRGIFRVEFSYDGGETWQEATLAPALSPYSWVLWTTQWAPKLDARTTIKVRAIDGKGERQIEEEMEAPPAGTTGLHTRVLFNVKSMQG